MPTSGTSPATGQPGLPPHLGPWPRTLVPHCLPVPRPALLGPPDGAAAPSVIPVHRSLLPGVPSTVQALDGRAVLRGLTSSGEGRRGEWGSGFLGPGSKELSRQPRATCRMSRGGSWLQGWVAGAARVEERQARTSLRGGGPRSLVAKQSTCELSCCLKGLGLPATIGGVCGVRAPAPLEVTPLTPS